MKWVTYDNLLNVVEAQLFVLAGKS